jgi:ribosomal protein S18 acetylase RimI-like enzyme
MGAERKSSIEKIGESGLSRVQSLAQRIWPECFAGILPPGHIDAIVEEVYDLRTLSADVAERHHIYWIAQVDGEDAGYASAYLDGERVWIKKLYLLDTCRGLGLGKRLIATALAAFPGAASVGLYVNDGNVSAINFYRAQGFTIEALVPVRMGPFDLQDYVMARPVAS